MRIDEATYKRLPEDLRDMFKKAPNDGSDEVVRLFPNDAARFFYCSKSSQKDRNEGCEDVETWDSEGLNRETELLLQLLTDISASTMRRLADTEWLTLSLGNEKTGLSLADIKSTIETASRLTTVLETSNSSAQSITSVDTLDAIKSLAASGSNRAESAERISQSLQSITDEETALVLGVVSALLTTLLRISALAKYGNVHSTVKPTDLMRYLCRLVTPPGGIVLDPFAGSGSTGKAAILEGFRFIGIELEPDHVAIAEARIAHVTPDAPAPNVNTSAQVYTFAHKPNHQPALFDLNTVRA